MCEPATTSLIQEVIEQKIGNDELFTAFDISLAVKELAISKSEPVERHRHMKRTIHETLEPYTRQGVYNIELWDVGAQTQANLYYPKGADPNTYVPVSRRDSKPDSTSTAAATAPISVADPADTDDGDGVDSGGRKADKRGSLTIPCFLLRQAGLKVKDVAYATSRKDGKGDDTVVLGKRVAAGCAPLTSYTVDKNGNVRVCNATLKTAGFADTATYDFERVDDQVIIRSH